MAGFSILLPPSDVKQEGGNPLAPNMFDRRSSSTFNYFSSLNPERRVLINALQGYMAKSRKLEEFFGAKGANLERAIEANASIFDSPLMSAMDRYEPGVMYSAMDFSGLPTGAQRRLLENGLILSGMFGLLRPDDLIPDYRLKVDETIPKFGKIAKYWNKFVSPELNKTVKGRFVWNFLTPEYEDLWTDDGSRRGMVTFKFYKVKKGKRRQVTQVKALRGAVVNFVVREDADHPDAIREIDNLGEFKIDEKHSTWDKASQSGIIVMSSPDK